jgi:AraC family transcriptional regulator
MVQFMTYTEIISNSIQYIEANLHLDLSLEELAARYYFSPMHFHRIFRAVTNRTPKSYILGRKLSEAALALKNTDAQVVDIAFGYGFHSHEQFTRDFLKMFHVSPSRYRKEKICIPLMERIDVIQRDFKNKNKDITVAFHCREFKEIRLLGREVHLNPECSCQMDGLFRKVFDFWEEYFVRGAAKRLFSIGGGDGGCPSRKFCFYGMAAEEHSGDRCGLAERTIPPSKYAVFVYPETMGSIFHTVFNDLDRWLGVTGHAFNNALGFEFIELHDEDYAQTGKFYLLVPVL